MSELEKTAMLPALAAVVLLIYGAAIGIAYLVGETTLLTTMLGATIPMAQTVLGYYFGSSRGSQAKDETIAATARAPTPPDQPVAIAINNPPDEKKP